MSDTPPHPAVTTGEIDATHQAIRDAADRPVPLIRYFTIGIHMDQVGRILANQLGAWRGYDPTDEEIDQVVTAWLSDQGHQDPQPNAAPWINAAINATPPDTEHTWTRPPEPEQEPEREPRPEPKPDKPPAAKKTSNRRGKDTT